MLFPEFHKVPQCTRKKALQLDEKQNGESSYSACQKVLGILRPFLDNLLFRPKRLGLNSPPSPKQICTHLGINVNSSCRYLCKAEQKLLLQFLLVYFI